jgi:hypothetical protein
VKTAKSFEAPLRFAGPPANLSAAVDLASGKTWNPRIRVAGKEYPLGLSGAGGSIDRLFFSMPDDTPPGEQQAEVVLGDSGRPAIVNIEVRRLARITPSSIDVKARGGKTVKATLSVTNCGNGSLSLDVDKAITLRASGMLGQSLASSLKRNDLDLADRLVSLGRELQRQPSHEVSVVGRMTPSTLDVGAQSQVTVELAIPEDIGTGTTWSGTLGLLGMRVRVSVEPLASRT